MKACSEAVAVSLGRRERGEFVCYSGQLNVVAKEEATV